MLPLSAFDLSKAHATKVSDSSTKEDIRGVRRKRTATIPSLVPLTCVIATALSPYLTMTF